MHGVAYYKAGGLWVARCQTVGLSKHIGYYDTREQAAQAYNAYVTEEGLDKHLNEGIPCTWPPRHGEKRVPKSKYRGVSKRPNGWMAMLTVTKDGKMARHFLGDFGDERSAAKAYNEACEIHGVPKRKNVLEGDE